MNGFAVSLGSCWEGQDHPRGRYAIFWLCLLLSDYVTGQVIPVNEGARGGMS
jgi:hypothetical protein